MSPIHWKGNSIPPLIVGTAQLGMDYGIANRDGQSDSKTANSIVRQAIQSGYTWFDTAQAYGTAETVLGTAIRAAAGETDPSIITKLAPQLNPRESEAIYSAIQESLHRLGTPSIWGLMLHRSAWIRDWNHGLGNALTRAKNEGLIQHIGVSIYTADELQEVIDAGHFDIIQLPFNAWDPEFLNHGLLATAQSEGICCLARSVYLQGLLMLAPNTIAKRLPAAYDAAIAWETLCATYCLTPVQLAMGYVRHFQLPLVVGVETVAQLQDNMALMATPKLHPEIIQHIQSVMHPLAKKDFVSPPHWQVKSGL